MLENNEERAERDALKKANMDKWGAILSAADTFDDEIDISDVRRSGGSSDAKASEWKLVAASAPVLLAILTKAGGVW